MKPKTKAPQEPTEMPDPAVSVLLKSLDFSPDQVVAEASHQPGLFLKAAEYRMRNYRVFLQAKMALESAEAERTLYHRENAKETGEKISEKHLENLLIVDPTVREARQKRFRAEEADEWAKLLLEAYRMRRDCLRIVQDLVGAELAMQQHLKLNADSMERTKENLRKKYPGRGV